ncbi:insecticidal delta-endotoxin Cry8Ea1 family protein [Hymenobacter edaphi]|uniref:Jacalin-type lectin domain-containing protein n=1 Tax=Hymenobacter edaphi TaxID=2211146 RepID=A0A328BS84_9BACT|nr:insecticidal delta-endotoxin Cry8Ea1 family protein [Hymenobacter edaphi]RAK69957.1 hypothetical protein DLM85_03635 [Hymenobacter edaphi]
MAFKAFTGQPFHLFAQHSGLVLGVSRRGHGAVLEQQTFDPNLPDSQQFEFYPTDDRQVFIRPKGQGSEPHVCLFNKAHHEGAPIGIGGWNGNTPELRFKFLHGGDGYYYIQCVESGQVWDVLGESKADKAPITQHGQKPRANGQSANQLFRPVSPAASRFTPASTLPFVIQETPERMRDMVMNIAGAVPEVGKGLRGLLNFMWPERKSDAFQQMRDYVVTLVRDLIDENNTQTLKNILEGLYTNIRDYEKEDAYQPASAGKPAVDGSPKKQTAFGNVLGDINRAEPYFFDLNRPETRLTYLVSLGTTALTALREQCLFWYQIYGRNDSQPNVHLQAFEDALARYTRAVAISRQRALDWRLTKCGFRYKSSNRVLYTLYTYTAYDNYSGWEFSLENTTNGSNPKAELLVREADNNHQQRIRSEFSAELEDVLAPTYIWPHLHPGKAGKAALVRTRQTLALGPYGGKEHAAFADAGGQPITRVVIHAGLYVDGLEVFYGGVSGGLHGHAGGNCFDLTLHPGETIVAVYGRSNNRLTALWVETSEGRVVGGGQGAGYFWESEPPAGLHAHLARVEGRNGAAHLEALTLHWEYLRDE